MLFAPDAQAKHGASVQELEMELELLEGWREETSRDNVPENVRALCNTDMRSYTGRGGMSLTW